MYWKTKCRCKKPDIYVEEKKGHKYEFEGLPFYHSHYEIGKKEMNDIWRIKISKEIIFNCEDEEEKVKTGIWKSLLIEVFKNFTFTYTDELFLK